MNSLGTLISVGNHTVHLSEPATAMLRSRMWGVLQSLHCPPYQRMKRGLFSRFGCRF